MPRTCRKSTCCGRKGFVNEIEKCHGCAKCTTVTSATRMCPVYKVTRDESATPRAKANILRMLISGAIDDSLLYHEAFQEVISRCISCGSCFHECPSGVNIPKMAMEARAAAISRFGASFHETLVVSTERAGKAAGKFSRLLTPFLDMPAVKALGEKVTGIASRRSLPPFAKKSLFEQSPFALRQRGTEGSLFCRLLRRLPAAVDRQSRHFGNVRQWE